MSTPAPAKKKSVKVKIPDLQVDTFVRYGIDQDYIFHLGQLFEADTQVEPILVTKSMRVIDGRCRIEAASLAGKTEIDAYVVDDMPRKDMLATALSANLGGSRAPTKKDIIVAIEAMLNAGASDKWVRESIPLPRRATDLYLIEARASITTRNLALARHAISDEGLTVEEAATRFKVTVDRLKTAISGRRSKSRMDRVSTMMGSVTRRNKSDGTRNGFLFKSVIESFNEGDITKEQAMKVFDEIERHGELSIRAAQDFRKRFFQNAVV